MFSLQARPGLWAAILPGSFEKEDILPRHRSKSGKLKRQNVRVSETIRAELTEPDTITDCCKNIDVVISTVGITRQKEGGCGRAMIPEFPSEALPTRSGAVPYHDGFQGVEHLRTCRDQAFSQNAGSNDEQHLAILASQQPRSQNLITGGFPLRDNITIDNGFKLSIFIIENQHGTVNSWESFGCFFLPSR